MRLQVAVLQNIVFLLNIEDNVPCWAWLEGSTIWCYANGFTDKNRKLPLESANNLFASCSKLKEIDLRHFETSKVASMSRMFYNCGALEKVDVSNLNTSKVTSMESMFSGCKKLTQVDISNFDTTNGVNMTAMFQNCNALTQFYRKGNAEGKILYPTNMKQMFENCYSLVADLGAASCFDASWFNTSKVTSMEMLFYSCTKIEALALDSWNISLVKSMKKMFANCTNLTSPFQSQNSLNWTVYDVSGMFANCSALNEISSNLSGFNTSGVTDMSEMFLACSSLTELDVGRWTIANVKKMDSMFQNCSKLKKIYGSVEFLNSTDRSKTSHSQLTSKDMFSGCTSIEGKNGSGTTCTYSSTATNVNAARIPDTMTNKLGYFSAKN